MYGREAAVEAMRDSHSRVFTQILGLSLDELIASVSDNQQPPLSAAEYVSALSRTKELLVPEGTPNAAAMHFDWLLQCAMKLSAHRPARVPPAA